MIIRIYVCPTPGCGNYYGSKSMTDRPLSEELRQGRVEDKEMWSTDRILKGSRADCPDCAAHGLGNVERQLVEFEFRSDGYVCRGMQGAISTLMA